MLLGILLGFVFLLVAAGYWGYLQGSKKDENYEECCGEGKECSFCGTNHFDSKRRSQNLPVVQVAGPKTDLTSAPGSDTANVRESTLPATVSAKKPHGRPSVTSQDWNRPTDDTPVQHFLVGAVLADAVSSDDSSNRVVSAYFDSGSSTSSSSDDSSSYSGGGGESGGGGASDTW